MQPSPDPVNKPQSTSWWQRYVQARQKGQLRKFGVILFLAFLGLFFAIFLTAPMSQELPPAPTPQLVGHVDTARTVAALASLLLAIFFGVALLPDSTSATPDQLARDYLKSVQDIAAQNPEKAKPVWDIAQAKLEVHFSRNLAQTSLIFYVSVAVMFAGFILLVVTIAWTFQNTSNITPALVGAAAGIITEFIGATFLFVYRSTVEQATHYLKTLEQINTVGMAIQILDGLSDKQGEGSQEKVIDAKITIAKLLLTNGQTDDKTQAPPES